MCGIAGILGDISNIPLLISGIEHRGNDGLGIYSDENLILAHKRLKLVGDGKQPMENERYVLTANCEIYNYNDLKSQIRYDFKTDCDTEVLLAGLTCYGFDFLNQVNGDFSFALWDKRKRELTLCRDRYGIRQLFYGIHGDSFYFASDVKTLLKVIPPEIDFRAMAVNFKYKTSPKPIFKNIYKLSAGSLMRFGQPEKKWYRLPEIELKKISYETTLDISRELIRDSIKLRKYKSTALMLGGIDSSLIYKLDNDFTCYNLFGKDTGNAKKVCQNVNIIKEEITESDIDKMILCFEQPYYALTPQWTLAREIKEKVVFSGLGADELLGGYHYYKEPYGLKRYKDQFTLFDEDLLQITVPEIFTEEKIDGFKTMNYYDITHYLANHHLYRGDQDLMYFTKEGRCPYLDHRIVEFWYSLPTEYKMGKRILTDIYGEKTEKIGFSSIAPPEDWINDNIQGLVNKDFCEIPKELNKTQRIHLAMTNRFLELFL